eukprot:3015930-Amphidinium_carterae.2
MTNPEPKIDPKFGQCSANTFVFNGVDLWAVGKLTAHLQKLVVIKMLRRELAERIHHPELKQSDHPLVKRTHHPRVKPAADDHSPPMTS